MARTVMPKIIIIVKYLFATGAVCFALTMSVFLCALVSVGYDAAKVVFGGIYFVAIWIASLLLCLRFFDPR